MDYIVDTKALRLIMTEQDIQTIADLESITGVNRNTLSDVLSGKQYPSSTVMRKLVHGLKMDNERAGRIFFASELTECVSE